MADPSIKALYRDLQASERKYRAIFDDSNDVIFISTSEGRYVNINPAVLPTFGYTREEALALHVVDLYAYPEDLLRVRQAIEAHGAVKDFEVLLRHKDSTLINLLINATVRHAADGTLLGYQGIVRDITEQKQNELLRAKNVQLETELDVVRRLQQMLLPTPAELRQVDELDIAGYMAPAEEVGGDYYDVLQRGGQVKIGIGDVTGHGLESGVIMLMIQMGVRTLLNSNETDPVRFLEILNRTVYDNVQRMGTDKNLTLSILDYRAGKLTLSGQHEEAIIVRGNGAVERIDTQALGFPIGLVPELAGFVDHTTTHVEPGDGVVLYTDGITEAENMAGEQYGLERLCTVVSQHWTQPAEVVKDAVVADLQRHIGTQEVFDDITLVVVKRI